jgi:hypothetical protein
MEITHRMTSCPGLEREFEGDNIRVVDQCQNSSLGEDMSDLAESTCYVGSADRLERIDMLRVLFTNLHDLSEGTFSDHFEQVEHVDHKGPMPSRLIGDGEMEGSGA